MLQLKDRNKNRSYHDSIDPIPVPELVSIRPPLALSDRIHVSEAGKDFSE